MNQTLVTVTPLSKKTAHSLSAVQKKFDQLSKKIERQKAQLQEWKETAELAQQQVHGKLIPLSEQLVVYRATLTEQLHEASLAHKFTAHEMDKLDQLILNLCDLSLNRNLDSAQEQRLKHIFEVHAGSSFEDMNAELEAEEQALKQQISAELGLTDDMEGIDPEDPESLFEHFRQQQEARQHAHQHASKARKKSAKQLQKEQQQQQADALASKSLKQIYQRLIANLHPDREQDEQEKIKKTALMQQVSSAYQAQDLIGLIELQIQLGQQNQASLAQLADEQLHLYNLNLSKHSQQLQQDIEQYRDMLYDLCRFDYFDTVTPKTAIKKLKQDRQFIEQQNTEFQLLIRQLTEAKAIKLFLKQL
jgi:hypothetical protein